MKFFLCISFFMLGELFGKSCTGCGTVPYPTSYSTPSPIIDSDQVWTFVTEPGLHPMKVQINLFDHYLTSEGLIFLAPYGFSSDASYGQSGSLIMDSEGNPIWFRPLSSPNLMNTDFRVQRYKGKPVLTFWQGTLATPPAYTNLPAGSSEPGSCYYILNQHYKIIKNVTARLGYISDIHEFLITPDNTALLLSTKVVPMDLTAYGGPQDGYVQDFAIQEVDLKTDKLIFVWKALDHIPLSASYVSASSSTVWDAYHLNSIGLTDDEDDIIVSSRNCSTIYRINKPTHKIIWELGGKTSDFSIESGGEFSWQHDARFLANNIVSMFDDNSDGSGDPEPPSHGLMLQLNYQTMTANVYHTYFHDPSLSSSSQGNLQSLPNGSKFVGWGQSPYFSEFTRAGTFIYDAQMPSTNYSYRAYKNCWKGKPCYSPKIAIVDNSVYASWNGSTETRFWKLYAGRCPKNLKCVARVSKEGFETKIETSNPGPYYQVKALNAKGKIIGKSKIIHTE